MIVRAKPSAALPMHTTSVTRASSENKGMPSKLLEGVDYDRLVMSLQSPLPNDQDMAISVCTLLSNETKHVLKFSRAPRILDLLLAHAGIFGHCKLREVMETSYWEARKLCHDTFWMENVPEGVPRHPLCECFVQKINYSIGIEDEYSDYFESDKMDDPDLTDEERWLLVNKKRVADSEPEVYSPSMCCTRCPCKGIRSHDPLDPFPALNSESQPLYLLRTTVYSDDRIGQRITQISNILRNLSFEEENAEVMANNPVLLRFVLISSDCSWGQIPQLALDLLGNIAHHLQLKEPSMDPLSCRILSLIVGGLFSSDRFRVLRSLESLRDLCKKEGNEEILYQYVKYNVYRRICELLTVSDIMLLIYTLECLLSLTGLGEVVCNELSRVKGSIASLVSLVTVEAQSYGPKGCILMRVVETVTGSLPPQQTSSTAPGNPVSSFPVSPNVTSGAVSHQASGTSPVIIPRPSTPLSSSGSGARLSVGPTSLTPSSIPLNSTNPNTTSALQAQLQQIPSSYPMAVGSPNPPARIPSPALSPSLSLSPVPSPVPVVHTVHGSPGLTHYQQQTAASPSSCAMGSPQQHVAVNLSGPAGPVSIHHDNPVGSAANVPSAQNGAMPVAVTSGVTQSSSQNLGGDMMPSISLPMVTPKGTLSEEGWAVAWLKGAFEVFPGTSIEQGESYRMYTVARKNPQKTLSLEQFVQCVKCAYGSSAGPVIKQFGSNSLSFFEGIRPKMSIKPCAISNPTVSAVANSNPTIQAALSSPAVRISNNISQVLTPTGASVTPVPSANVQTKENSKTLSPILKATLSRPPKPKNSGVVERQQKKLEQEKGVQLTEGKVNGVDGEGEDSSASSFLPEEQEHQTPVTSFQGVLRNGLNSEESSKDEDSLNTEELSEGKNKLKGMLIDLLERKVNTRESPNGIGNREIRISDRGLELVDKPEDSTRDSCGGNDSDNTFVIKSVPEGPGSVSNCGTESSDTQNSQQMTFYAASTETQVTLFGNSVQKIKSNESKASGDGAEVHGSSPPGCASSLQSNEQTSAVQDGTNNNGGLERIRASAGGGGDGDDGGGGNSSISLGSGSEQTVVRSNQTSICGANGSLSSPTACPIVNPPLASSSPGASSNILLDETDLLEKFNEISDLIVVPPEQLGIKRPRSESQGDDSLSEPPSKKINIEANGNVPTSAVVKEESSVSSEPILETAFIQSSVPSVPSATPAPPCSVTKGTADPPATVTSGSQVTVPGAANAAEVTGPKVQVVTAPPPAANSINGNVQQAGQATLPNQMMQLRLSVNPSNQLAFTRQLVLPSGQQLILSTTTTQAKNPLQGQVIISKPHVTSNDQMAKAIIILQPSQQQHIQVQQQQHSGSQPVVSQPQVITTHIAQSAQNPVQTLLQHQLQQPPVLLSQQNPSTTPLPGHMSTIQVQQAAPQSHQALPNQQGSISQLSSQLHVPPAVPPSNSMQQSQGHFQLSSQAQHVVSQPKVLGPMPTTGTQQVGTVTSCSSVLGQQQQLSAAGATSESECPYICEWAGCGQRFDKPAKVFLHASKVHTPETLTEAVRCEWGPKGCDPLLRKRLSLMTHLQDRHCTKHALELSLYRRRNKIEPPPAPSHPAQHHLGYAPNAAFHAIKRHAMQFTNPKELLDDNEGPVTKSIRLTAALILKNIVQYSASGRRILRGYESQLATIAMSNVESSRTVAQLLYDMKELPS